MNDQNLVEHCNCLRQQSNHQRGQKRDGTPSSDPSLIRRHTTPDMAASAAYGMVSVLCGTDELEHRYRGRIEKVKFGVPVNEAFSPDIPATLLVLLLKVNKEGPLKKDIWRAPGNQAQVRKLSNIMQHGRLVNISNISVYTAASVIKRFLAKLPGGILGADNEKRLFESVQQENFSDDSKRELFCRIVSNLPIPSQHLIVLLFGTFRVITDSAETFGTRMTPEAIGISVAPSLFHTCIHDGQRAKLDDILRFKIASQVISEIIRGFGYTNLFPRECYEFYARITGRTLRVDEQWHFSFQLPSNGIGCFNPIAVNRRNSHRSQRKSSSSASSIASVLSQLQSTPPVQINDNFDLNAKTPENYLPASPKNYLPPSPKNYPPPSPGFNPISISRRPPPPTSALQRRIDAYCAAANLNSKEQNLIQKRKS
uniref:Rho-GAP domain-containing protein n=1 Tax=Meloidogyne incognita TaxID=6306 RepID=A0A914LNV6_MELIC